MPRAHSRSGFSLVEVVVAMTLTLAVFAITLPFVRSQTRALSANAGRLDAEQTARFAQRVIDRDLRLASGVTGQPILVYAGPMGITFNANLLARDSTDPAALEIELGADSSLTEAWRVASAAAIPLGGRTYPTVNYADASGVPSRVETVSYFLHPDTVAGRNDLWVLYRRVNARDSVQLVRSLYVADDSAFFSYFVAAGDTLARVAASGLPLYWDSTSMANVRAVGIAAAGRYQNRLDGAEHVRKVNWRVVLPNAALVTSAVNCGTAPTAPSGVTQSKQTGSTGYHVRITWNSSTDDNGGAYDVSHYVVSVRSTAVSPVAWSPVAIVPAMRNHSYRYEDHMPSLTGGAKYGVRAVDCGGLASGIVEHASNLSLP